MCSMCVWSLFFLDLLNDVFLRKLVWTPGSLISPAVVLSVKDLLRLQRPPVEIDVIYQ